MIYALVNNNYQLIDLQHHLVDLRSVDLECTLITVPHTLNQPDSKMQFSKIYTFTSPLFHSKSWFTAWLRYYRSAWDVWKTLKPGPKDTLLLYTEFELLNHLIVHRFHSVGAKIFLIEDGGVATYLPFSTSREERLSAKQWLTTLMVRCLPHLHRTMFHRANGIMFPWVKDNTINALCVYRPIDIKRNIPVILMKCNNRPNIVPQSGRVIFLNEPIYDYYLEWDKYLTFLGLLLSGLSSGYSEVWFKFHPREKTIQRERIKSIIESNHSSINIIQENESVENLLDAYRPEAVASFMAATLLNLDGTGIEPIFLYHLCKDLADQDLFNQLTRLLSEWEYYFVESFDELRSGYQCGWNSRDRPPRGLRINEIVMSNF